jgi:hypothetical protein
MIRFAPVLVLLVTALAPGAEEPKGGPFRSKEGKFSVALPDKPTEKTNKVKLDAGEVELHLFSVAQKDHAYVVTYNDFPKPAVGDDRDKFLTGVVERNVASLKGKLASDVKVALGKAKHPGREIRVEIPDQKRLYRARLFLVGDRLYQVVALGPDEFVKGKAVDDYLNSFAVDE